MTDKKVIPGNEDDTEDKVLTAAEQKSKELEDKLKAEQVEKDLQAEKDKEAEDNAEEAKEAESKENVEAESGLPLTEANIKKLTREAFKHSQKEVIKK